MKLIKIDIGYVIVESRLPKIGELYLDYLNRNVCTWHLDVLPDELPYCDIITHSTIPLEDGNVINSQNNQSSYIGSEFNKIKKLEYSDVCRITGEPDLNEMANKCVPGIRYYSKPIDEVASKIYYKRGFCQAQELSKEKRFTIEDIIEAIKFGCLMDKRMGEINHQINEYVKSLEPSEWVVEIVKGKIKLK